MTNDPLVLLIVNHGIAHNNNNSNAKEHIKQMSSDLIRKTVEWLMISYSIKITKLNTIIIIIMIYIIMMNIFLKNSKKPIINSIKNRNILICTL